MIKHINFDWLFKPDEVIDAIQKPMEDAVCIAIPHTHQFLPFQYANEHDYQFISTYQKMIPYDVVWKNKYVTLHFEGVAHEAKVYLNGHFLGIHQGGYTPFSFDITPHLIKDKDQIITVFVNANESLNIPPFGHVIDYLTFGGIYREVYLQVRDRMHIEDVFVYGKDLLDNPKVYAQLKLSTKMPCEIEVDVSYQNHHVINYQFEIDSIEQTLIFQIPELHLWNLDNPHIYQLKFKLLIDKKTIDSYIVKTGFRDAIFKPDGFYLNGEKIKLIGLNRHQDYPYVGYAMPKSAQYHDAYLLKYDLNCHIVRTSHYPQSKHFINACDDIGLLVFEEIPGWQYIGDSSWKDLAKKHVKEMVLRDRNHPSIILWGVRINESGDDDIFYQETNHIAHELDDTRQTAGVRFITHSSILEDVFTLNDFIHEGHNIPLRKLKDVSLKLNIPYLVTEHTGHMFPTKSFDHEQKRLDHAKRHLNVINHMFQDSEISGVIGWCMHDYYTHIDFGSGDKICYHGVLDMFRNPKIAAYPYQSNQKDIPYLEISTNFNIGDYPKGFIDDVLIFSNCDQISVYRNDEFLGNLSKDMNYPHLPFPPFKMDWFGDILITKEGFSQELSDIIKRIYRDVVTYGEDKLPYETKQLLTHPDIVKTAYQMYGKYVANWGTKHVTYTFKGYMNEQQVIEIKRGNDYQQEFLVYADSQELMIGDTYDVTRITIEAINENGMRLPYSSEVFKIETDDLLEIIGPSNISLIGGIRSFWVKTKQKTGTSYLTISHDRYTEVIPIQIKEENE